MRYVEMRNAVNDGKRYLELITEIVENIAMKHPDVAELEADIESLAGCVRATVNAKDNEAYRQAKAACDELRTKFDRYLSDVRLGRRIQLGYLVLRLQYVALENSISGCLQTEENDRVYVLSTPEIHVASRGSSSNLEIEFVSGTAIEDGDDFAITKDLELIAREPKKKIATLSKYFDGYVESLATNDGFGGIDIYEVS